MVSFVNKLKPASGFYRLFHFSLQFSLPILIFILIRLNFVQLAFSLILLSKWRMFAIRPRFWPVNIQANAIDIIVGISLVLFMVNTTSMALQLMWVLLYIVWLTVIKPATNLGMVSLQALIGQFLGLMALYVIWSAGSIWGITLLVGVICYFAARHFLNNFEEPYDKLLAYFWAYFAAAFAWLTGHWLIYYKVISQPALLLSILGYGLALLYYFDNFKKINRLIRWQFLGIIVFTVILIVFFSGWTNKAV